MQRSCYRQPRSSRIVAHPVTGMVAILLAGCATAGSPPPEPLHWPTGEFALEGSVFYESGLGTRRDHYVARLFIAPDGSMSLDSDTGVCLKPTLRELQRDEQNRRRTFECGDVTFEVRPASGTVVGDLEARVMEDREFRECVEYATDASGQRVCRRSRTYVESVEVTKEAQLRVSRERS